MAWYQLDAQQVNVSLPFHSSSITVLNWSREGKGHVDELVHGRELITAKFPEDLFIFSITLSFIWTLEVQSWKNKGQMFAKNKPFCTVVVPRRHSLAWGAGALAEDAEVSEVPWEQMITARVCNTCVLLLLLAYFSENILLNSVAIYISFDQSQVPSLQGKEWQKYLF